KPVVDCHLLSVPVGFSRWKRHVVFVDFWMIVCDLLECVDSDGDAADHERAVSMAGHQRTSSSLSSSSVRTRPPRSPLRSTRASRPAALERTTTGVPYSKWALIHWAADTCTADERSSNPA